eukprot:1999737-Ditylum_brightwellii.AAC.1
MVATLTCLTAEKEVSKLGWKSVPLLYQDMIFLASTQNGVTGIADPPQSLLNLLIISSCSNSHHYIALQLKKMG